MAPPTFLRSSDDDRNRFEAIFTVSYGERLIVELSHYEDGLLTFLEEQLLYRYSTVRFYQGRGVSLEIGYRRERASHERFYTFDGWCERVIRPYARERGIVSRFVHRSAPMSGRAFTQRPGRETDLLPPELLPALPPVLLAPERDAGPAAIGIVRSMSQTPGGQSPPPPYESPATEAAEVEDER
jgi:hypothetical protein